MGLEYRIKCTLPPGFDCSGVLGKLPSPISSQMTEIYNYKVHEDGFYVVDNLVDKAVASYALRLFIDEALKVATDVVIYEP
jgi:hypothetical protein